MSAAGWYPDPGGQPGLFRYWDGRAWSASTSAHPRGVAQPPTTAPRPADTPYGIPPRRRSPLGWILGGLGVVAVLVVAVVLVVRSLSPGETVDAPAPRSTADAPTSASPSAVTCPESTRDTTAPTQPSADRVVSGHLSYPRLSSPFAAPIFDRRIPFGVDVQNQVAPLEKDPDGVDIWAANVLIARLLAGDGFYSPQQGSTIVVACILGKFYGDNKVGRTDLKNQASTVDGHQAWLVESKLTYDISGIKAKSELMIVEVIATAPGEGGLFYASIPNTAPQLVPKAEAAMADLRVS